MLTINEAQKRISLVWYVTAALAVTLLIAQTVGAVYEDLVDEAWSWLLPNIMPTLSLITGVLISDNWRAGAQDGKAEAQNKPVDGFIYRLALSLSIAYGMMILLSIIIAPWAGYSTPLDFIRMSSLWLAPMQSLISAVLGVFFVYRRMNESDARQVQAPHAAPGYAEHGSPPGR